MNEPLPGEMSAAEAEEGGDAHGYSIVLNCHSDGTHDVFQKPLEPASEEQYPDGLFGLDSIEDALKGVLALKKQAPNYAAQEEAGMMQGYGVGDAGALEGY